MKIFSFSTIASAVAAPALAAATPERSVVYTFDPELTSGIGGTIRTTWDADDKAMIEADLNFAGLDGEQIAAFEDENDCTTDFVWSLHTEWTAEDPSAGFDDCGDETVTGKVIDAKQFTSLTPGEDGVFKKKWTEAAFPRWGDQQPEWNIVIQAVCGKSAVPLACANGIPIETKRKHLRVAKAIKKTKKSRRGQYEAKPDIFILPTDGEDNEKGDYGDEENPHYGGRKAAKGDYGDEENPHYGGRKAAKGDYGDEENPHYGGDRKSVHVRVALHHPN